MTRPLTELRRQRGAVESARGIRYADGARLDVLGPSAAVSVDVLLPLMRVRVLGFGLTGTSVELKRFMLDVTTRVASAAAAATGSGCGPAVVSKSFPIYSILPRGAAAMDTVKKVTLIGAKHACQFINQFIALLLYFAITLIARHMFSGRGRCRTAQQADQSDSGRVEDWNIWFCVV